MRAVMLAAAALLLPYGLMSSAEQPRPVLLSTAALARNISMLQGPDVTGKIVIKDPKARLARLRREVSRFVSNQIEAYPSISECDLQKQLVTAFAIEIDGCPESQPTSDVPVPRVFAEPWGPRTKSRVFAVSYGWFGFYGTDGSQTVLESYVWNSDRGVSPGSGIVPSVFSGLITQTEQVCWFPDPSRHWLLVFGTVGGSSGRTLGGSAAVFEIGPQQTRVVWTAPPNIGDVMAYAHTLSLRWEIEYTDTKRFYGGLSDAKLLDIYQVDWAKRTFRRLIHHSLE